MPSSKFPPDTSPGFDAYLQILRQSCSTVPALQGERNQRILVAFFDYVIQETAKEAYRQIIEKKQLEALERVLEKLKKYEPDQVRTQIEAMQKEIQPLMPPPPRPELLPEKIKEAKKTYNDLVHNDVFREFCENFKYTLPDEDGKATKRTVDPDIVMRAYLENAKRAINRAETAAEATNPNPNTPRPHPNAAGVLEELNSVQIDAGLTKEGNEPTGADILRAIRERKRNNNQRPETVQNIINDMSNKLEGDLQQKIDNMNNQMESQMASAGENNQLAHVLKTCRDLRQLGQILEPALQQEAKGPSSGIKR